MKRALVPGPTLMLGALIQKDSRERAVFREEPNVGKRQEVEGIFYSQIRKIRKYAFSRRRKHHRAQGRGFRERERSSLRVGGGEES